MNRHSILYIILVVLLGVFVIANWGTLSTPSEINLLFGQVVAPIGILVLAVVAALLLVGAIINALRQRAWTRERLELSRELEQSRLRADSAEESRIRSLRETVEREIATIRAQLDQLLARQTPTTTSGVYEERSIEPITEHLRPGERVVYKTHS
jgi:uncharacterized integral membrane protein